MRTRRVLFVLLAGVGVACGSSTNGTNAGSDTENSNNNTGGGSNNSSAGNGQHSNNQGSSGQQNNSQAGGSSASNGGNNSSPANSGNNGGSSTSGNGQQTTGGGSNSSSTGTGGGSSSSAGNGESLPGPAYITSAQNAYWQTGTMTTVTSGTATLTVNDSTTYQTFSGFGGAFNEKGWVALQSLSASDQTKAMTLLFDWTNGAHLTSGRIPIGASDYATSRYTDDDTSGDYSMADFSINRDKTDLIPYVQAALAVNPNIDFWASPWTPPPWMKENATGGGSSGDTSAYDGGTMSTDAKTLTAFALYESMWITAYEGMGIHISQLMPQNEPNYGQTYPSCLWAPSTYDQFVSTYLGPELASKNPNTQIFLGTMSCSSSGCTPGDSYDDANVVSTTTADTAAMKYIHGFGFQWNEYTDIANVTKFNMPIWQTEHQAGNDPWGGANENTIINVGSAPASITFNGSKAPNDFNYGVESYGLIARWLGMGANAYSAWNMVLDTNGLSLDTSRVWPQNALLAVDTGSKTLNITPAYYVFRHFSQYVAPGATRVGTSGGTNLNAFAFKNPDGSHAVIMFNSSTSSTMATISVGGKMIQVTIPGSAFATLKT